MDWTGRKEVLIIRISPNVFFACSLSLMMSKNQLHAREPTNRVLSVYDGNGCTAEHKDKGFGEARNSPVGWECDAFLSDGALRTAGDAPKY